MSEPIPSDHGLAIAQKNWEILHQSVARFTDLSWKIKAWGISVWWAVVGYSFDKGRADLIPYLFLFVVIVFVVDLGVKLTEEVFLSRAIEMEGVISDFLNGDFQAIRNHGISTNITAPDRKDIWKLFTIDRVWFRLPYWIFLLLTAVLLYSMPMYKTPELSL